MTKNINLFEDEIQNMIENVEQELECIHKVSNLLTKEIDNLHYENNILFKLIKNNK
ncbi:hypothetical protein EHP00_2477 [Ecytonucleospora hepatopenaei]|uniref:Uncharacterized protein n=1 Tax=Ecytonucleospora hepatopenaei TaxID=646526 RepID=A0A1W0E8S9_9MICR|nr:hypothetical protein EHP00_2477 [Ecytonucleospora hepatopenaei]